MRVLAAYDVVRNRTRRRISSVLQEYGVRIQWSLFELELQGAGDLAELQRRLRPLLDSKNDRLALYPIDRSGHRKEVWLGAGPIASIPDDKPTYFVA